MLSLKHHSFGDHDISFVTILLALSEAFRRASAKSGPQNHMGTLLVMEKRCDAPWLYKCYDWLSGTMWLAVPAQIYFVVSFPRKEATGLE
jgi:hypothetical protein